MASNILWVAWFQTPSVHLPAAATVCALTAGGLSRLLEGSPHASAPRHRQAAGAPEGTAGREAGGVGPRRVSLHRELLIYPCSPLCSLLRHHLRTALENRLREARGPSYRPLYPNRRIA